MAHKSFSVREQEVQRGTFPSWLTHQLCQEHSKFSKKPAENLGFSKPLSTGCHLHSKRPNKARSLSLSSQGECSSPLMTLVTPC
ncbi:hypothetical protein QYF61_003737 [Mycteria americana]|uniref:Uncharacterized protein n=1 Tax=Mycteria americana TaxID=33587 RepID=A0AAN7MW21_MYCAM|nr:hypothetical protein QYF61_003737 [Mycteria americana]